MVTIPQKYILLIMLLVIPLLVTAPVFDSALAYLDNSQNLRTSIQPLGNETTNETPDFMIATKFSLTKPNFVDRYVTREIDLSISGNHTPGVSIAYLSSDHKSWESDGVNVISTGLFGEKVCGFDSCITYSNLYQTSPDQVSSTDEWNLFGALYAPLDWYQTTLYCVALNATFAFGTVSLEYSLPQGYEAGIENLTLKGPQITTNLAEALGNVPSSVPCFRIDIARAPLDFLALVTYTTIPLVILWYVAVITIGSVPLRKDRIQIYVGALFASFAYFLSIRQYLQSIITLLDVLTAALMVGWIMLEAVWLLLE